jgi:hypothetical protein
LVLLFSTVASAQTPATAPTIRPPGAGEAVQGVLRNGVPDDAPDTTAQFEQLKTALIRLPLAAGLASLLALRPRRRGTPPRKPPVIQTQIILAIVGAVVMLVVGASLARAFGIVGAAGLVRYRAKIDDPKDAGVMLSTLGIGLASGVGLWMLAALTTVFILGVLWIIESYEQARHVFVLKIASKDAFALKPKVEHLLLRHRALYELRTESAEELSYEVKLPIERKTDHLSTAILVLDPGKTTAVEWEPTKEKK